MDIDHCSRHYIGIQAARVRLLPSPGSAPFPVDSSPDLLATDKLMVLGGWNDHQQLSVMTLASLRVSCAPDGAVAEETLSVLHSAEHVGEVTGLVAVDAGAGRTLIFSGSSKGGISRMHLSIPSDPGKPGAVVVRGQSPPLANSPISPQVQCWRT